MLQHKAFIWFWVFFSHKCLPARFDSSDKYVSNVFQRTRPALSVKTLHAGALITTHSLSQDKQSTVINAGRAIGPESWIKATGGSGQKPIRRRKPLIKSCMVYRLHQFYFSSAVARAHNFPVQIPGQLPSVSEKSQSVRSPRFPCNKKNNNRKNENWP